MRRLYRHQLRYSDVVEIGDTLLVHHNVFKYYYDMKGRQKSGRSHLMDDLFLIEPDQYYMYKKQGRWHTHDRYCFVKPAERSRALPTGFSGARAAACWIY
jgi:hypothetical protein